MNTQLYNTLVQAKNFMITVRNNEDDLYHRREMIKLTPSMHEPFVRGFINSKKKKKFDWGIFIFLLLTTFIGGLIYKAYIDHYNDKLDKKEQKVIEEWEKSPEGIKAQAEAQRDIERQKREYEYKRNEYARYFVDNYPKHARCFSSKPKTIEDIKHQIEYVNGLIGHVRSGAQTLEEAKRRYGADLRFIRELDEKYERRELEEQRHKEQMDALGKIAKNQERTNDELNRMYRDTFLTRF